MLLNRIGTKRTVISNSIMSLNSNANLNPSSNPTLNLLTQIPPIARIKRTKTTTALSSITVLDCLKSDFANNTEELSRRSNIKSKSTFSLNETCTAAINDTNDTSNTVKSLREIESVDEQRIADAVIKSNDYAKQSIPFSSFLNFNFPLFSTAIPSTSFVFPTTLSILSRTSHSQANDSQSDSNPIEVAEMHTFSLIKESYKKPKGPLVFAHGLMGFDTIGSIKPLQFSYWIGIREALEAMDVPVLIARVPASASIKDRATVLHKLIEERFPGQSVNLIGHSMGGLDCRFLISSIKPTTFKIKSLTTIATPHQGSYVADFLLQDIIGSQRVPALLQILEKLGLPGGGKAFDDLTTKKMEIFNRNNLNDPSVKYFSYGAKFQPSWGNAFRLSWGILNEKEGDNDGLVSVTSARWGEYLGTIDDVNHLDLIGWVGKLRFQLAKLRGKEILFKPVSFYCSIAEMLAEEGL